MSYDLLRQYSIQMGVEIVKLPQKMEIAKVQMYPSGLLKEIADRLKELEPGLCIQMNYEALTNSNASTLHTLCRTSGWKLHCLRNGDKRILYVERAEK